MPDPSSTAILTVWGDALSRSSITSVLRNAGYCVSEADSGSKGLESAIRERPALVILVGNPPDMSSVDVLRSFKSDPESAIIPLLHLISNSSDINPAVEALQISADAYLVEPVEPAVLLAMVATLIRTHALQQELIRVREEAEQQTEELRRTQQRLQTLLDALPVGVTIAHDPQCRVITANHTGAVIFEVAPKDNISASAAEDERPKHHYFHDGRELPANELPMQVAMSEDRIVSDMEVEMQSASGRRVHLLCSAVPLRDETGAVRGGVTIASDITRLKNAEAALTRERNQMALLADTASVLLEAPDPLNSINNLAHRVMEFLDCHVFFNYLVDTSGDSLQLNAYAGITPETADAIHTLAFGEAVCGSVARDGCRIVSEHIPTLDDSRIDLVKSFGVRAYACHPIKQGETILGTLSFGSKTRDTFTEDDLTLMKRMADQMAIAIMRRHTEEALQESEEQLRVAFESAPIGIEQIDLDGHFLRGNGMLSSILSYTEDELRQRTFWEITHPDDHECEALLLKQLMNKERQSYTIEKRYIRADGTLVWVRITSSLAQGTAETYRISVIEDITERMKAEEARRESEERYRQWFTTMQEGSALHEIICDATGKPVDYRFLEVNPAFEALTSLSREDIIGKTVREVMPETEDYWIDIYGQVALSGEATRFEQYSSALARWYEVVAFSPRHRQFAVLFSDITARKKHVEEQELLLKELRTAQEETVQRAEELEVLLEELQEAKEKTEQRAEEAQRQRRLLEETVIAMPVGVMLVEAPTGKIILANREVETIWGRAIHPGMTITEFRQQLAHRADGTLCTSDEWPSLRAFQTGEPVIAEEIEIHRYDGEQRTVILNANPVLNEEGKMIGGVVVDIDITTRRRLEKEQEKLLVELSRQQNLLNITVANTEAHLVYLDRDFNFVWVNQTYADGCGYTPEEMVGLNHFDLYPHKENEAIFAHVRDTGEPYSIREKPFEFPDQPERGITYWDWTLTPVKDTDKVIGLVLSLLDVTEKVQQRAHVEQVERERARLAETMYQEINHRMKNNLALLAGVMEVQLLSVPADSAAQHVIKDAMSRLTALSVVHEQFYEDHPGAVDLLGVLRGVAEAAGQALSIEQLDLCITGDNIYVSSKLGSTLAILANELITNAVKHGTLNDDGHRPIEITLSRSKGMLRCSVWNVGAFKSQEKQNDAHIGLGLELVQDIVIHQFQGDFTLQSHKGGTLAEVVISEEVLLAHGMRS